MRLGFLGFLFTLVIQAAIAQQTGIAGRVVDSVTHVALSRATVILMPDNKATSTDEYGRFNLKTIARQNQYIGYRLPPDGNAAFVN